MMSWIYVSFANAENRFLQATTFPKTFDDISFIDKMSVLSEGYDAYESVFDENGVCVSGCAYRGITLEQEIAITNEATDAAVQDFVNNYGFHQTTSGNLVPNENDNVSGHNNDGETSGIIAPVQNNSQSVQPNENIGMCTITSGCLKSGQLVPYGHPLGCGKWPVTSPFGKRSAPTAGASKYHKGIDFGASTGTSVYSTAKGTVIVSGYSEYNGNWIKISHSDGYETAYLHLSKRLVNVGDVVDSGCQIGLVGTTGISTGPHLHYMIKRDGTAINPSGFLGNN